MSLRMRLSLLFAIGTAALIAISGLLFIAQLGSSINAAIDATLRARSDVLVDELRAGLLPGSGPPAAGQYGQQTGQHSSPGADEFAVVLTARGSVLYPPDSEIAGTPLSSAQLRQAGAGQLTAIVAFEGERARILARPVRRGGHLAIAMVGVTTSVADAARARSRAIILIGGPLAVAAAGMGAWLLTGAALGPVDRMRRRLDEISERDSTARLTVPRTRDEIASLATTTNRLLDRLQLALARQRGFVADAGHELRTPLTALRAELELATRPGKSQDALAAAVSAAAGDADRLIRLTEDLLFLARADEGAAFPALQRIDASSLITASARSFAAQADARGIAIATSAPQPLMVLADPDRLRRALDNMIGNAIGHSPSGGTVEVTGTAREVPAGHKLASRQMVSIEVRDYGRGFPPEFLPYAFDRFRRADLARHRADGGTGLGLAIVASIAAAHGGRAVAENDPSGGARVWIELPDRAA